jgi:hypothetical protein
VLPEVTNTQAVRVEALTERVEVLSAERPRRWRGS